MILLHISNDAFGLPSFTKNGPGCRSAGLTLCRAGSWTALSSFQLWRFFNSMIRNYFAHRRNSHIAVHTYMSVPIIFTPSPARKPQTVPCLHSFCVGSPGHDRSVTGNRVQTPTPECHKGQAATLAPSPPLKFPLLTGIEYSDSVIPTISLYCNFCLPCFSLKLFTERKTQRPLPL